MITSSEYSLLKEVYNANTVEKIINDDAATYKSLKKSPDKIGKSGWRLPIKYGASERGAGAQNFDENFRESGHQDEEEWLVPDKFLVNRLRWQDRVLRIAKKGDQSYLDAKADEIDEAFITLAKEANAQIYRDGSGRIAQVNGAVVNNATITFDNGVPTHLRRNMYIDIVTGADVKEVDSKRILSIDTPNNQITLESAVSCSDDSYIVREDVRDNIPTGGKELSGFVLGTDDGSLSSTFQGLDRTTNNTLDGITINAGGSNLSADLLQRAWVRRLTLGGRGNKGQVRLYLNPVQMRKYFQITTIMKEYQNDTRVDAGHKQVPTWNGHEFTEDTDCPFDSVFMIDTSDYKKLYLDGDFSIMDEDGNQMRQESNRPAYSLQIGAYLNLGLTNPTAHARIHNLAQPTW